MTAVIGAGRNLNIDLGGSATITDYGQLAAGFGAPGTIFVKANQNITLGPHASIEPIFTSLSSIILVVDDAFPSAPLIGPGAFLMDPTAVINSGAPAPIVQIFTARRSQNSILGLINGASFSPGPVNVNTQTEQWGFYYPQSFAGSPFTIFYKEPQTVPNIIIVVDQTVGTVFDLLEEFASPLPFFDDHFCMTVQGDMAKGLYKAAPAQFEGTICPWIQDDNYRKFYPSLQRWGYLHQSE
ncbi:MAG: hypothetical protein K1X28_04715 [Parachlamydiales bacterium]|nr:hypothetical protein [Parachlamydiales bacterium]